MYTLTRRISDHHIITVLYLNKIGRKYLLHIPTKKGVIIDGIQKSIFSSQCNSLRSGLQPNRFLSLGSNESFNGAYTSTQVIKDFATRKCGKIPNSLIKHIDLLQMDLIKRLGINLKPQTLHLFVNKHGLPKKTLYLTIVNQIMFLTIH